MDQPIKILCVDDEQNVLRALQRVFMDDEYEVFIAASGKEGLGILEREPDFQVIVSDYRMPGMDGVEFLKHAHERWPETIRIVLSGYADTASIVAAINEGQIYKFIPKPWDDDALRMTINEANEVFSLRKNNERLADELMDANTELTILNTSLEEEVRIRTSDLEFQCQVLKFGHNVMNSLPVGVIGMDPDGLIVLNNKLSEGLFNKKDQSLLGLNYSDALPREVVALVDQVMKKGESETEIAISQKNYSIKGLKLSVGHEQEGIILVVIPE
jgi:two-component system NtrC family sensor kinase